MSNFSSITKTPSITRRTNSDSASDVDLPRRRDSYSTDSSSDDEIGEPQGNYNEGLPQDQGLPPDTRVDVSALPLETNDMEALRKIANQIVTRQPVELPSTGQREVLETLLQDSSKFTQTPAEEHRLRTYAITELLRLPKPPQKPQETTHVPDLPGSQAITQTQEPGDQAVRKRRMCILIGSTCVLFAAGLTLAYFIMRPTTPPPPHVDTDADVRRAEEVVTHWLEVCDSTTPGSSLSLEEIAAMAKQLVFQVTHSVQPNHQYNSFDRTWSAEQVASLGQRLVRETSSGELDEVSFCAPLGEQMTPLVMEEQLRNALAEYVPQSSGSVRPQAAPLLAVVAWVVDAALRGRVHPATAMLAVAFIMAMQAGMFG